MGCPSAPTAVSPRAAVTFLIDGYNLLFRLGYATKKSPAPVFDAARRQLLDWLAAGAPVRTGAARVRVVFDAVHGPFPSGPSNHKGVTVEFSYRRTADDHIADLAASERQPHLLTVVSDDHGVRQDARRAHAKTMTLAEFLDWSDALAERLKTPEQASAPEKPGGPMGAAEAAELLRAFGG